MAEFIETGEIVNTHGIRGMVRAVPWCDSPEELCSHRELFIGGAPYRVLSASAHKSMAILELEGVDTVQKAQALKGKKILVDRAALVSKEGRHLICDLVGCAAVDDHTDEPLGEIKDVLCLPASDVYVIEGEKGRFMVPVVDEFVRSVDTKERVVRLSLIEGMLP